jgi:hypothetical protein
VADQWRTYFDINDRLITIMMIEIEVEQSMKPWNEKMNMSSPSKYRHHNNIGLLIVSNHTENILLLELHIFDSNDCSYYHSYYHYHVGVGDDANDHDNTLHTIIKELLFRWFCSMRYTRQNKQPIDSHFVDIVLYSRKQTGTHTGRQNDEWQSESNSDNYEC